jgi:hypothetical protein
VVCNGRARPKWHCECQSSIKVAHPVSLDNLGMRPKHTPPPLCGPRRLCEAGHSKSHSPVRQPTRNPVVSLGTRRPGIVSVAPETCARKTFLRQFVRTPMVQRGSPHSAGRARGGARQRPCGELAVGWRLFLMGLTKRNTRPFSNLPAVSSPSACFLCPS